MDQATLAALIEAQSLPSDFKHTVEKWYIPLLHQIKAKKPSSTMLLGVQGTQGSGKSTLAEFIKVLAEHMYQLNVVSLSQDDFYLTQAERITLAEQVHPLFTTRGVPGTHDIPLAIDTINALKAADASSQVDIPRFNKAIDDRAPKADWDTINGPVDLVIFEGWCVGCGPQADEALDAPTNELEANEDSSGAWRRFVNEALKGNYKELHDMLDALVVLQAPSFDCVYEWRWLQEQKLAEKLKNAPDGAATKLLDENSLKRFISHYERLTNHCLNTLPNKADWVLTLEKDHSITQLRSKAKG